MRVVYWVIGGCLLTQEQALGMPDAAYKSAESLATTLFTLYPVDNVTENILDTLIKEKQASRFRN